MGEEKSDVDSKRKLGGGGFLVLLALLLISSVYGRAANAAQPSVIDFEGLPRGLIVDTLSSGNGISGEPVDGEIAVLGFNPGVPDPPPNPLCEHSGSNWATIYDAACKPSMTPADCTGGDDDLFRPELGNVLIVNEIDPSGDDGIIDEPDDDDFPDMFRTFDFSAWGPGKVRVDRLTVLDVEPEEEMGAQIDLWGDGVLLGTFIIPQTGDNTTAVINMGVSGVDLMCVTLNGSGAIDNIELELEDIILSDTPTATATATLTVTPTETITATPTSTTTGTPLTNTPTSTATPTNGITSESSPTTPPAEIPPLGGGPGINEIVFTSALLLVVLGLLAGAWWRLWQTWRRE